MNKGRPTKYHDVMDKERFKEVIYSLKGDSLYLKIVNLTKHVKCGKSTIYRYIIDDQRELSSDLVKKICVYTGVSMDWLYGLSEDKYRGNKK